MSDATAPDRALIRARINAAVTQGLRAGYSIAVTARAGAGVASGAFAEVIERKLNEFADKLADEVVRDVTLGRKLSDVTDRASDPPLTGPGSSTLN